MSERADSIEHQEPGSTRRATRPQLPVFYAAAALIALASYAQFEFLVTSYWFIEDWISKGPLIWLVSLFVIHRELSAGDFRRSVTVLDLGYSVAFVILLVLALAFDPLLAPTLLIVFAWYLCASGAEPTRLAIVWLFLLFSLPYYSQVVPGLQALTVFVSENLLDLLGVPVLVQEFYIAIPDGLFFVEQGCSGFNYLANNLLLLFLYSLMSRFGSIQFLLALAVSLLLSLAMNWIRVLLIILFAHYFGVDHPFIHGHVNFGWFLYALFLVPYFYLLLKIDRKYHRESTPSQPPARRVSRWPAIILLAPPLLVQLAAQWYLAS